MPFHAPKGQPQPEGNRQRLGLITTIRMYPRDQGGYWFWEGTYNKVSTLIVRIGQNNDLWQFTNKSLGVDISPRPLLEVLEEALRHNVHLILDDTHYWHDEELVPAK